MVKAHLSYIGRINFPWNIDYIAHTYTTIIRDNFYDKQHVDHAWMCCLNSHAQVAYSMDLLFVGWFFVHYLNLN